MAKNLFIISIPFLLFALVYSMPIERLWAVEPIAIRGGVLIDGTGRPPVVNSIIIIEDGKISQIFREGEGAIPDQARIVEAAGRYILPGFVDCRVGLVIESSGAATSFKEFTPPRIVRDLRANLYWGVTTIRSVGDSLHLIMRLRDSEQNGSATSPRLYVVGPVFTAVGGYPAAFLPPSVAAEATRQLNDLPRVKETIQELAAEKVDMVTVVYDGGNQWNLYPKLSLDLLQEIIREAHKLNLRVSARIGTVSELKDAVRAGVDGIEHGATELLDDEAIQLMLQHGTYYCPNLAASHMGMKSIEEIDEMLCLDSVRRTVSEEIIEGLAQHQGFIFDAKRNPQIFDYLGSIWQTRQKNLQYALKSGVKIALGTGAGESAIFHGLAIHDEMFLMVDSGASPMQTLVAGTQTTAAFIGADKLIGTLEVGKLADILIITEDPLKDISATRNIELVIKGGKIVDRDHLLQ
jgi:imidazolonepropionase-like amidohydrolase